MLKKNIHWLLLLIIMPLLASCSWEDLPAYEEAEITGVQFHFRWKSTTQKDPITNEPVVKEVQLTSSTSIDSEAGNISVEITVPAADERIFPESARNEVSLEKLWAQVTLSTAARLTPIDGSAPLGTPEKWTKPHSYIVTAANGTQKKWTITVTGLNK